MTRKQIILAWLRYNLGLVIYSFGVYCTIHADIGAAPWDVFYLGLSGTLHTTYGVISLATGVLAVALDLWMGEKIGFGTLFDAVFTGFFADFWMYLNPVRLLEEALGPVSQALPSRLLVMAAGLFILSLGTYFCMSSGQSCGPKDAMLIGIGKRLRAFPIGAVQILLQAAVLFIGWFLGGPVGIGTVMAAGLGGTAMQIVFNLLRFEPRDTVHYDLIETVRMLTGKA